MLKTCGEISLIKNVSRQAVQKYINHNNIQPSGKKGTYPTYDIEKEPFVSYLAKNKPPPEPPPPAAASAEPAILQVLKPLNNFLLGQKTLGDKPAEYLFARALMLAQENQDAALYFKLAQLAQKEEADEAIRRAALKTEQAKEKIAESRAERIRLEYEIRREEYMSKAAIKLIFGKQYAIDTSVLVPMGLKLADSINAIPSGPERRQKIQELIDNEVFAALESKKRILADFIETEDKPIDI